MRPTSNPLFRHVRVGARCLANGARVLGPGGKPFTQDGIGMVLAMRDLQRHMRELTGGQTVNAGFTKRDRSQFLNAIENAIQAIRRGAAQKESKRQITQLTLAKIQR